MSNNPFSGGGGPPGFSSSNGPSFGNNDDNNASNNKPWVWVLIPVGIVVVIAGLAVCLHARRRRQRKRGAASLPPPNNPHNPPGSRTRAFNEHDLEEAWVRGAPAPGTGATAAAPSGGRWARTAAGSRPWYFGSGSGSGARGTRSRAVRPEEGLNELGEAPPPYEKPTTTANAIPKPPASSSSSLRDQVELQTLASAPPLLATATGTTATTATSAWTSSDARSPLSPITVSSSLATTPSPSCGRASPSPDPPVYTGGPPAYDGPPTGGPDPRAASTDLALPAPAVLPQDRQ
ncbi:hypothetical protein B0T25DRAFT_122648 [Lasiosphaeria hispida]|uniref:Uncharacterized protein n=1 Tax=Lasiosphaeria hispida TaxID=260671 RepID=A0AAJ0HRR2_9PEZI|nr:hypothetical protein B0T25DRAFT_122648 [Lasiosphaeria hispida]